MRTRSAERAQHIVSNRQGILALVRADYAESERRPTVFLDRDGVLNKKVTGGYVTKWSEFVLLPGVFGALRRLQALGLQLVIVSNQAAVAKGLLTWKELSEITQRSLAQFHAQGSSINGAFFCLHQPSDGCKCRKPGPGLLEEAARRLKVDFRHSFLIGDSHSDILAGEAVGCSTVYLATASDPAVKATYQCRTLSQAVRWIQTRSVIQ